MNIQLRAINDINDIATEPWFQKGERGSEQQSLKGRPEGIHIPDLTSHSEYTTVGQAVEKLKGLGIPHEQIKFRIAQSHASLGEIVAQDPPHDVKFDPEDDIRITVGTWAKDNNHRFSFFASETAQSTQQSLDVDQLDVWDTCKSDIVHLYAALDQKSEIDGDGLIELYGCRMLVTRIFEGFKRSLDSSGQEMVLCTVSDLLSNAQWPALFHGLKIRSSRPFNLIDFKTLICGYYKLTADKVDCRQEGFHISVTLHTFEADQHRLQSEFLKYLFCPLDRTMGFRWQPPPPPPPLPIYVPPPPYVPPWWLQTGILCGRFAKWLWRWLIAAINGISAWAWLAISTLMRWLLQKLPVKRLVAPLLVIVAIFIAWIFIVSPHKTPPLTHTIESIGGMSPYKAIKKGMANTPYQANGVTYKPMSREAAIGYRQEGIASYYGNERAGVTVSGETYDPTKLTAAHETLPIPCKVRVTNLKNNRHVILTINDRGPFLAGRMIDVSEQAARVLGFHRNGKTKVLVEVIDPPKPQKELLVYDSIHQSSREVASWRRR